MEDTIKKVEFIIELEKLKNIFRKSKLIDIQRLENSAEHSWHVAIIVMVLAEDSEIQIDVLKTMKMMLLHDIVEIDAGDTFIYDKSPKENIFQEELKGAKRIFGLLPESLANEFLNIWLEFEEAKTNEAKFAKAVDRIMPVLQNINNSGQTWVENKISKDQVIEKCQIIDEINPKLWEYIKNRLDKEKFWE